MVHQNSCKDQVSECVKQKYGKVSCYDLNFISFLKFLCILTFSYLFSFIL